MKKVFICWKKINLELAKKVISLFVLTSFFCQGLPLPILHADLSDFYNGNSDLGKNTPTVSLEQNAENAAKNPYPSEPSDSGAAISQDNPLSPATLEADPESYQTAGRDDSAALALLAADKTKNGADSEVIPKIYGTEDGEPLQENGDNNTHPIFPLLTANNTKIDTGPEVSPEIYRVEDGKPSQGNTDSNPLLGGGTAAEAQQGNNAGASIHADVTSVTTEDETGNAVSDNSPGLNGNSSQMTVSVSKESRQTNETQAQRLARISATSSVPEVQTAWEKKLREEKELRKRKRLTLLI